MYDTMNKFIYGLILVVAVSLLSCSDSATRQNQSMEIAENVMQSNVDSALGILETIDPSELKADSLKARYHYLKAYCHLKGNRSMIGDSLIIFSHNYYRSKDKAKAIRSGTAAAWYKFWVGDPAGALTMLDSIASLPDIPDSIMTETLRLRVLLGASEYQGRPIIPLAKRLITLETDSMRKFESMYMLLAGYEYASEPDSALRIIDTLIDFARKRKLGDKHFLLELERSQLLTEKGRNAESDSLINDIFRKSGPDNGAALILHFQQAVNAINTGNIDRAVSQLAMTDSILTALQGDDETSTIFQSYTNLLHAILDFRHTGKISLIHIAALNNRQSERYNRMKASQWESERAALQQQSKRLALKAESEHKTVVILILSLLALVIAATACWIFMRRRQHEREKEERIEALQKMVEEYKESAESESASGPESSPMRSLMLRHLGIIKMVAQTPTEQNREMLRRISSLEGGETDGALVDWKNIFGIIDTLYDGFYAKLHAKYGDRLTLKEEQIIVLMMAGFSTKEISVITGQTTATIYVRKTSIRKKLGAPEKEDIVAFLRNEGKS